MQRRKEFICKRLSTQKIKSQAKLVVSKTAYILIIFTHALQINIASIYKDI